MIPVRQSIGGLGNLMFKQAYIMGKVFDGEIPDVYVQSTKYWEKHKEKIKAFFSIGIGERVDKVSLHIRRGDYLTADHFHTNLWNTDYYQNAVKMFPNDRFIVFCRDRQSLAQDMKDRDWCEENLPALLGDRWELAPIDNDEVQDMNLMASCKAHIMANSTFSWWASFISGAMTVCPKFWFTDGIQRCEILPEWVLL